MSLCEHLVSQEILRCTANLGVPITWFGNGDVIFVKPYWIDAYSWIGRGGSDDERGSFDGAQFEICDRLNPETCRMTLVPVIQVAKMGIVLAKVLDADCGTKDFPKGIGERS